MQKAYNVMQVNNYKDFFMSQSFTLSRLGVFTAVGYICAGTIVAILAGLPLFSDYLESNLYIVAAVFVAAFIFATAVGMLLIHYLVPRYGAKNIYEQDILIYMIGMLFMALTLNKAMFLIGIFITFGALSVFFYENFTRQVAIARRGFPAALALCGWAAGPIVCVVAIALGTDYGLLSTRIIFAHFIVIGFWVWTQRLSMHEEYSDAPTVLLGHLHHQSHKPANPDEAFASPAGSSSAGAKADSSSSKENYRADAGTAASAAPDSDLPPDQQQNSQDKGV